MIRSPSPRLPNRGSSVCVAAASAAWALVMAVAGYATVRVVEVTRSPPPDPAAVAGTAHAAFLWRVWTVLYGAALFALTAFWLVRTRREGAARALAPAVAIAATCLLVQSVFFP